MKLNKMNKNKNIFGTILSMTISIVAGIFVNSMPTEIKGRLDLFFGNYPEIWIGGIVFVFLILLINIILAKFGKQTSKKDLENRNSEEKAESRKLFINSLEKRYRQKLIQKTDERFSPPMELKYTKDGVRESYTLFLDDEAKTENEVCEELAVLLNKHRHLLILGQPGVGKTVRLHEMALGLLKNAFDNPTKPIPVIFNLATWTDDYENLEDWFIDNLIKNYNFPPDENIKEFVSGKNMIPLLDGFDEIGYYIDEENERNELQEKCLYAIHDYRNLYYNPMFVIGSRNAEYINAGGNMAVNAQIEVKKLEEKKVIAILDNLINIDKTGVGVYENSNDNVAKYLKIHISKTPILLKVLCVPFYLNALFQVLNRRNDDKIDFPNSEQEIKNFIVDLFVKRKTNKKSIYELGSHLRWLAKWTKRKKKVFFNLTDFDESCLQNPKSVKITSSFLSMSFEICLWFYLFLQLSVVWGVVFAIVFFVIGGGFKNEEEKTEKKTEDDSIEKTEEVEYDDTKKFQYHWKKWYRAVGFALFSWLYFGFIFGFLKGLLCAIVIAVIYRSLVSILKTSSPLIGLNSQRKRLEQNSRKDELRKWNWKELFTLDFWTHTIFEMFLAGMLVGLIFALAVKVFGTDWEMGLYSGTVFGVIFVFGTLMKDRAYQIKYYEGADKPMKRLLYDLIVNVLTTGFIFFGIKFCIDVFLYNYSVHISVKSALIAGSLGMLLEFLRSLFFKNLAINVIVWIKGKLPFPMSVFFNDCVKAHILELENSSWKFSHQILTQFFIDNFSKKTKDIKELEKFYDIQLTELDEEENIWEHRNAYKLSLLGNVVGLNLSSNRIEEIRHINSLTKLQELNLSRNKINKIEDWSFCDYSIRHKRLKTLDLSNNKISDIENLNTLTGLRILNLSNNKIENISIIPSAFKRLTYLYVRENDISNITNIQDFLQMKYLWDLAIECNPIEREESDTLVYIDKINNNTISFLAMIKKIVVTYLQNPFFFNKEKNYITYFNKFNKNLIDIPQTDYIPDTNKNIMWNFVDGILTISGIGIMPDYGNILSTPWANYQNSIKKVIIENGITHIGSGAFWRCENLSSVEIPNTVISIGSATFMGTFLKFIKIPESVTSIGDATFGPCPKLNIEFSGNLKHIGSGAFYNNAWYRSLPERIVYVDNVLYQYKRDDEFLDEKELLREYDIYVPIPIDNRNIKVKDGTLSISKGAFKDVNIESIEIPNSVLEIGAEAFNNCRNLTDVILPANLKRIEESTFENCKNLNSIDIPESVTEIGKDAFSNCENLKSISLKQGLLSIGAGAFYRCKNLTTFVIPETVVHIGESAFSDCENLISVIISKSVISIGKRAFEDCKNLENVSIQNEIIEIEDWAFNGTKWIRSEDAFKNYHKFQWFHKQRW